MPKEIVKLDGICGGQPVIEGTRTSVLSIISYLEVHSDKEAILRALPHLSTEDIDSALAYYRQISLLYETILQPSCQQPKKRYKTFENNY